MLRQHRFGFTVRALALIIASHSILLAQQTTAPSGLTIRDAVENAVQNYPAIRVSQEQINAAAAGIELARTAYLPRIDALAQVNRATRNNVFGLLCPRA
jgi:outer membrane protein